MDKQLTAGGRDAYFDNAKALLIVGVVLGHTLSGMLGETRWMDSLYMFIYTFHMPAFIFVTGYYAKVLRTKRDWWKLIKSVVLPYFIFQFLYTAYYIYVLELSVTFNFFENLRWGLWFLVSLFCWRVLLPFFTRSKWMIVVALVISLIAGELPFINELFSLSRTVYFFVFFIAGYHLSVDPLKKAGKRGKLIGVIVLVLIFISMYVMNDTSWREWLFGRLPYIELEPFIFGNGMLNRLTIYMICGVAMIAFLAAVPTKKYSWTVIGQRTMAIYLFHLAAVQTFRQLPIYEQWLQLGNYYFFFLFVFLTIAVLALPLFSKILSGKIK
ncbi:MAG: acyltransferase family protein [Solibacillus sp.]|uniref:acyltransferase family protein n=1 Tax=unclassified Solibacillus TaxID=2637870 RepID=UPI0031015ABC